MNIRCVISETGLADAMDSSRRRASCTRKTFAADPVDVGKTSGYLKPHVTPVRSIREILWK